MGDAKVHNGEDGGKASKAKMPPSKSSKVGNKEGNPIYSKPRLTQQELAEVVSKKKPRPARVRDYWNENDFELKKSFPEELQMLHSINACCCKCLCCPCIKYCFQPTTIDLFCFDIPFQITDKETHTAVKCSQCPSACTSICYWPFWYVFSSF